MEVKSLKGYGIVKTLGNTELLHRKKINLTISIIKKYFFKHLIVLASQKLRI